MVISTVSALLCALVGLALGVAWLRSSQGVTETINVSAAPTGEMCTVGGGSPLSSNALAGSSDLVIAGYRPLAYTGDSGSQEAGAEATAAEPLPTPSVADGSPEAGSSEPAGTEVDVVPMASAGGQSTYRAFLPIVMSRRVNLWSQPATWGGQVP